MKLSNKVLTHPVLMEGSSDFIEGIFVDSKVEAKLNGSFLSLEVSINTNDETLNSYLLSGEVIKCCLVECVRTRYREIYSSADAQISINLPMNLIDHAIEISTCLIASKKISNYSNKNFSYEFEGLEFELEEGSYLAICKDVLLPIERQDSMSNTTSIFEVMQHNLPDKAVYVNTDAESKISIYLEKSVYENYLRLKNDKAYKTTLMSLIGTPVIIEVLSNLDELQDKNWYPSFVKRLNQININPDEIINRSEVNYFKIADSLVGFSLSDALININRIESSSEFLEGEA